MDTKINMNIKKMREIVSKDKHFQRWIDGLGEGTQRSYLYSMAGFCLVTGKLPTELLEICKEDYSKPPWEREINDWFSKYDKYCEDEGNSLDTYRRRKTNVRGFFRFNGIETPISLRRRRRDSFSKANDRKLPKKEEIIDLLNATNSLKEKAIILTQFSSGLSNSDVVRLTVGQFWDGLDDNDICKIRMRRHKNSNEFVTFISPEAVQVIKSYLQIERDNLNETQPLFTKFKTSNAPLETIAVVHTYARLNDALGWSKDGNAFRKITGHMGRKWLKTNLTNAGMPREPLETLLGHQLRNGTDDNYYIMNEEHLKSIYLKYLPNITIEPVETLTLESDEFKEVKKQLTNNRIELEQKDDKIRYLEQKLVEFDKRLKKSEGFFEEISKKQKISSESLREAYYE